MSERTSPGQPAERGQEEMKVTRRLPRFGHAFQLHACMQGCMHFLLHDGAGNNVTYYHNYNFILKGCKEEDRQQPKVSGEFKC